MPRSFLRHFVTPALGIAALPLLASESVNAQDALQPGESFVTRFFGTTTKDGRAIIDTAGTVGSIIDLRATGRAPQGAHWVNEQQRVRCCAQEGLEDREKEQTWHDHLLHPEARVHRRSCVERQEKEMRLSWKPKAASEGAKMAVTIAG